MKKSELKHIIKEEISKALKEESDEITSRGIEYGINPEIDGDAMDREDDDRLQLNKGKAKEIWQAFYEHGFAGFDYDELEEKIMQILNQTYTNE